MISYVKQKKIVSQFAVLRPVAKNYPVSYFNFEAFRAYSLGT